MQTIFSEIVFCTSSSKADSKAKTKNQQNYLNNKYLSFTSNDENSNEELVWNFLLS